MLEKDLQQLLEDIKKEFLQLKYNIKELKVEEPYILLQKPVNIGFRKEGKISDFFVDFYFLLKNRAVLTNNYYQEPARVGMSNAEFLLNQNIKIENVYAIVKVFSNAASYNEIYYTVYKDFSSVSFKQQFSRFLAQQKDIVDLVLNRAVLAKNDKELLALYQDFTKRIGE